MNSKRRFFIIFMVSCFVLVSPLLMQVVQAFEIDQVATCTYVYDGDSFETTFGEVRLADIDAPEYNDTSRDALVNLINNEEVYLDVDDVYQTDPYGRYVCVTYIEVNATHLLNVNQYLLDNGFAVVTNYNNEFNPASWTLYTSKISTHITCSVSPSSVVFDESAIVSGAIHPIRVGVEVTVRYTSPEDAVTEHQVFTAIDGSYTDTITTSTLGNWMVDASWSGDSFHLGSTSTSQPFTVTKRPSSLSCYVPSSSIEIGNNITLSGALLPMRGGVTFTLNYRQDTGWTLLTTVTTSLDGSYSFIWTPPTADTYQFQATWPGDPIYADASSTIVSLTVSKLPSTLTCNASATTITIGDNVTLRGEVNPMRSGIDVTLQYQTEIGWTEILSVATDTQGQYAYLWTPSSGGDYQVRAMCSDDNTYSAAVSAIQPITVEKLSVTIMCTVPPVDVEIGNDVRVSGSITPAIHDVPVTLQYIAPNASTMTHTVTTSSDGSFTDTMRPDATGSWRVSALWEGDTIYDESVSTFVAITVTESSLQINPLVIGIPLILVIVVVVVFVIRRQ
ncbi:MAG: Ig-like domain repeat protein [Candidatus Bathyarchaeota archaeon]|nr:Ig-like domain repeat protein [Candidatus Bathyarchaeota archaeon]